MMDIFYRVTETSNVPILDVEERFGMTGYIDYIEVKDMPYDIMRGIDMSKRPFLAVKYQVRHKYGKVKTYVSTIFQRYSDYENKLTHGTAYSNFCLFPDALVNVERDSISVCKLCKGESIYAIDACNNEVRIWLDSSREQVKRILTSFFYKDLAMSILEFI